MAPSRNASRSRSPVDALVRASGAPSLTNAAPSQGSFFSKQGKKGGKLSAKARNAETHPSSALGGQQESRGRAVEVQVQIAGGLPNFLMVGLPDKAVGEARELLFFPASE